MFRSARKRGARCLEGPGIVGGTFSPKAMSSVHEHWLRGLVSRVRPCTLLLVLSIAILAGTHVPVSASAQTYQLNHGKSGDMSGSACVPSEYHMISYQVGLGIQSKHIEIVDKKACGEEKCRCCIDGFCSCMKKTQCDTSGGACKAGKPKEDGTKSGWYRHVPFTPRSSAIRPYAGCTTDG